MNQLPTSISASQLQRLAALTAAAFATAVLPTAVEAAPCATAWTTASVYVAGDIASKSGTNYMANWWTQGNDPATNSGPSGSGQPWTTQGACTAGPSPSPAPAPGPAPAPAPGPAPAPAPAPGLSDPAAKSATCEHANFIVA